MMMHTVKTFKHLVVLVWINALPTVINLHIGKAISIIIYRDIDDALIRGVLDRIVNQVKDIE